MCQLWSPFRQVGWLFEWLLFVPGGRKSNRLHVGFVVGMNTEKRAAHTNCDNRGPGGQTPCSHSSRVDISAVCTNNPTNTTTGTAHAGSTCSIEQAKAAGGVLLFLAQYGQPDSFEELVRRLSSEGEPFVNFVGSDGLARCVVVSKLRGIVLHALHCAPSLARLLQDCFLLTS